MVYNKFIALGRGLLRHPPKGICRHRLAAVPTEDASAIHGQPGAQVALLQSPILPAAGSRYSQKENFPTSPVDKPHTRISRIPRFSRLSILATCLNPQHFAPSCRGQPPLGEDWGAPVRLWTSQPRTQGKPSAWNFPCQHIV